MSLITRREICALAAVMPLGAIASSAQAAQAKAGAEESKKAELSVLLFPGFETCKSSKDHSKPRNEVDTSLKSPV